MNMYVHRCVCMSVCMGVRMYVFPVQLPARGFVYALLTCMYVYIHIFGERERELERERERGHFGSSRPAASLRGALEGGPVSPLLGAAGLPGGRSSERREA